MAGYFREETAEESTVHDELEKALLPAIMDLEKELDVQIFLQAGKTDQDQREILALLNAKNGVNGNH